MKTHFTDETLQAVIDAACNATASSTYRPSFALLRLAENNTTDDWQKETPARLHLIKAALARLPDPQPPVVDVKTPGQVAFGVFASDGVWNEAASEYKQRWEHAASAVLAAFGHSGLDAAIARMEAVPWNELPGEVLTAESIRARLIKAARDGQSAPKADIYHDNPRYRIKPWTLPPPPEGQEWHRTDWTEDMLPEGWRPLLKGEARQKGDEFEMTRYRTHTAWQACSGPPAEPNKANERWCYHRTRRPLPQPPVIVPLDASDIRATDEFKSKLGNPTVRIALNWSNEGELAEAFGLTLNLWTA